jgi:hypothetical protein
MKPSLGTDFTSFLGVALGAAAGVALTVALVTERAQHTHHDVHHDDAHLINVLVGHEGKHFKAMNDEVLISELVEAEIEAEQAKLEGRKVRLRVEPQIRVERRERQERRR